MHLFARLAIAVLLFFAGTSAGATESCLTLKFKNDEARGHPLRQALVKHLRDLVPESEVEGLATKLVQAAEQGLANRPLDLLERDSRYIERGGGIEPDITYVVYPDGIIADGKAD